MGDEKNINDLIKGYKEILENLENAQNGTKEQQNKAIKESLNFNGGYCCGSCIAISSICNPDATPNKCKGGCTATSFAF